MFYKDDYRIEQPINILPSENIFCQSCKRYFHYKDAVEHTHERKRN